MDEAVIEWTDGEGKRQYKSVPQARSAFDFPESYPEARKPGARIWTPGITYYYDRYGDLQHYDNHGRSDW